MSILGEEEEEKFELFDLNNVYIPNNDDKGVIKMKKRNILDEIRKQENAAKNDGA